MPDRYQAMLDGNIPLEIQTIQDTFEKSIAAYEFPYRDGAMLGDMGQKARKIRIRCFFINENYNAHIALINYLNTALMTEHELTHPKYGLIKGQIEISDVRHEDLEETAEVDLNFIENLRGSIEPTYQTSVESSTEEAFLNGQDELMEELELDLKDYLGAEAQGMLDVVLDPAKTLFEQFSGLSKNARSYIKTADIYVRTLNRELPDVANPASSLIASFSYTTNLPGAIIGLLARTIERYAILAGTTVVAPFRFLSDLKANTTALSNTMSPTFEKYTKIASAQRSALEFGSLLKTDNTKAQAAQQAAKTKSFTALGVLVKAPQERPLTVNEIEQSLALVNTDIQACVNIARGMQNLKDLALTLTNHVIDIKIERDKIVKVSIDNTLPLHLVCLKYGLPYNYAERILLVNNIKNPSFVTGEVSIYAR